MWLQLICKKSKNSLSSSKDFARHLLLTLIGPLSIIMKVRKASVVFFSFSVAHLNQSAEQRTKQFDVLCTLDNQYIQHFPHRPQGSFAFQSNLNQEELKEMGMIGIDGASHPPSFG